MSRPTTFEPPTKAEIAEAVDQRRKRDADRKQARADAKAAAEAKVTAEADAAREMKAAADGFAKIATKAAAIDSVAVTSYGELVIVVTDAWHYDPKPIRLQSAQSIGESWSAAYDQSFPDFSIRDLRGNEVGGLGILGVWVVD